MDGEGGSRCVGPGSKDVDGVGAKVSVGVGDADVAVSSIALGGCGPLSGLVDVTVVGGELDSVGVDVAVGVGVEDGGVSGE